MALLETLVLSLGPAIAKNVLKLWLKDSALGEDISSNLVDLLGAKVKDVNARQKSKRQFEELGEKVAENLLPLFKDSKLSDESQQSVAFAVATTLSNCRLTAEFLAQRNLDPQLLERHLLATGVATTGLNENELEFFRRILGDAASYIVDIASLLPNFTDRTLSEILKREREILDVAEFILGEVRRIREESLLSNSKEDAIFFEEKYRRAIGRILDVPDIFGLDSLNRSNQRYRLSVAYVSLSVIRKKSHVPVENSNLSMDESVPSEALNPVLAREPVELVLAKSPQLLICGQAGSGKTTLLRWIAVNSASANFNGILEDRNNMIPFFIPLRNYVGFELPRPDYFVQNFSPEIADLMPKHWVYDCLNSGRGIVLIDGVDEIPQNQRRAVYQWLEGLVIEFPNARFVITSRPSAIEEGWLDNLHFYEAELQPMELPDIYTFIDHWHSAVGAEINEAGETVGFSQLAIHFKEIVTNNRPIFNLATNPLLCAALCALHRDRHQQVPSNRIEIYEALSQMLLDRREKERDLVLEGKDYPKLTYSQKRILLEELAYWMILNGWSTIEIEDADRVIKRKIKHIVGVPEDVTSTDIRRLFVDRSGIVREPSEGSLDFIHRTMQEFFAANAILDREDIGVLRNNAHDDQWHQVIILASGLANPKIRERIIREILQRGNKERIIRQKFYILALTCLDGAVELSSKLQEEIKRHLVEIIPPRTFTEARAIAAAHDLAVPFLEYHRTYSAEESATCIQALAMIGSQAAFTALKTYLPSKELHTASALVAAESSFDRAIYIREITSYVDIDELWLANVTSLECLSVSNLRSLSILTLCHCIHITDFQRLVELTELRELNLENLHEFSSLDVLYPLRKLKTLGLKSLYKLQSLFELSRLSELTNLSIEDFPTTTNLGFLSYLPQLISLRLAQLPKINDLSSLTSMSKLTSLVLRDLPHVHDLTPLVKLPLSTIYLDNHNDTIDIEPLLECRHLKELRLGVSCEHIRIPYSLKKRLTIIEDWKHKKR